MQTETKQQSATEQQPKSKGGRPKRFSPASISAKTKPAIELTIEGDFVVIKLPRKELSRKLLAELI